MYANVSIFILMSNLYGWCVDVLFIYSFFYIHFYLNDGCVDAKPIHQQE